MIAKRITSKAAKPRYARLAKYMVAAEGKLDPRSWTRTADYMLASAISTRGEKVGGVRVTNCHTDDPAAATTLIEATQAANTRSKTDKTYHLVFSFPPGEEPPLEILHKIEDELVASIGYADHQRISAVHIDTDHLHVHVAINKVHPKGFQNIEPFYDKKKLMEACDRLEIEYGLTRTNHGLTGERKHAKHKEIELSANYQFGIHTPDGLYQSHVLALAAELERSDNDSLSELPGGNVARVERGYSELLPGDARNRVLRQGNQRPEGLRWSGLGANSEGSKDSGGIKGRGLNDKAADAEAHSGIESLQGHVSREVAPKLKEAKTWQEAHSILAKHGLQIKKRGAGLVIGNGEIWVKASQCDRALSLKALSDRLGPMEQHIHPASTAYPLQAKRTPYEPKPIQKHPSSAALYEQYQKERNTYQLKREHGLEQIKYEGALLEYNLKKWNRAQRLIVKAGFKGPQKLLMLKTVKMQTQSKRKKNQKKIDAKRKEFLSGSSFPSWSTWLAHNALDGNEEALAVLRSRQDWQQVAGNWLSAGTTPAHFVVPNLRPNIDKHGHVFYQTYDGGLVIDRSNHVQCFRTTTGAAQFALELAAKRFKDQALIVEGSEEFKKEVARLANIRRVNVRFADPVIEQARKNPPKHKSIEAEI